MYNIKLERLSGSTHALREGQVTGVSPLQPTVGERFTLYSQPLENPEAAVRYVSTSPVVKTLSYSYQEKTVVIFETESGTTYQATVMTGLQ
jgi:phage tail sheath protein FI